MYVKYSVTSILYYAIKYVKNSGINKMLSASYRGASERDGSISALLYERRAGRLQTELVVRWDLCEPRDPPFPSPFPLFLFLFLF